MENNKRHLNLIVDVDPGVDDCAAIVLSLYDAVFDIKLLTTVAGNVDLHTATRNMLHLLEKFKRTDIPVSKGASKPMKRAPKEDRVAHKQEGMGGYIPPDTVKTQPIKEDAVEAMYKTICQYPNDITIIELGPHTNLATLLEKHPDVKTKINQIVCEGCAPYGYKGETHISFNVSVDPEAFKIVLDSGIPVSIVPSMMGRKQAHFTEKQVYELRKINDAGRFLFEMYSGFWERNFPDKRIALCDSCACLYLRYPECFKTRKANFEVNTTDVPGRTIIDFTPEGKVTYLWDVNRKALHNHYIHGVMKLDWFHFYKD